MEKREVLSNLTFGARVAEDEGDALTKYFVETDYWNRLWSGDVDILYVPKGSGKTALYGLLLARTPQLRQRSIIAIPAENPRGAPAFQDLVVDPPASETEFVALWKLYFACLISRALGEQGVDVPTAESLRAALAEEGLVAKGGL